VGRRLGRHLGRGAARLWWLDPATVYALSVALIAAIYIGFAVADGRPRVIAVETVVAAVFVVVAAAGSPDRPGCWWPASSAMGPRTCGSTAATLSPTPAGGRRSAWSSTWIAAAILVVLLIVGVDFHP